MTHAELSDDQWKAIKDKLPSVHSTAQTIEEAELRRIVIATLSLKEFWKTFSADFSLKLVCQYLIDWEEKEIFSEIDRILNEGSETNSSQLINHVSSSTKLKGDELKVQALATKSQASSGNALPVQGVDNASPAKFRLSLLDTIQLISWVLGVGVAFIFLLLR
jgi:hypothetical protein